MTCAMRTYRKTAQRTYESRTSSNFRPQRRYGRTQTVTSDLGLRQFEKRIKGLALPDSPEPLPSDIATDLESADTVSPTVPTSIENVEPPPNEPTTNAETNSNENDIDNPICVLSSAVYEIAGSVGTDPRAMTTYRIPVDMCSGYNLIAKANLPDGWEASVLHDVPTPRLYAADRSPLQIAQAVRLLVRLGNTLYRL